MVEFLSITGPKVLKMVRCALYYANLIHKVCTILTGDAREIPIYPLHEGFRCRAHQQPKEVGRWWLQPQGR